MPPAPRFADHSTHIMSMINAAVASVDPFFATRSALTVQEDQLRVSNQTIDLGTGRLFLVAIGKAAVPMANGAINRLGDQVLTGVAVTKAGQTASVQHPQVRTLFAAHPVPDQRSVDAADAAIKLLESATEGDFVLFLISGGASALCTWPLIEMKDWQALSQHLLASGCTIQEFNTVRKQLDKVKGGGLAEAALPARFATLVLSDVIGNPISMIGSGPTVPNPQTPAEAAHILTAYGINNRSAITKLKELDHQPPGDFEAPYAFVGDLEIAAKAAHKKAVEFRFDAQVGQTTLIGEAREVGKLAAKMVQELQPGSCLILGGETTVTLSGNGIGGRNQELALAAAIEIDGVPDVVVATYATDGDDGPTDAAGAIVTGQTMANARQKGLNAAAYLASNNSNTFFKQLGNHLIITGQTGTNVNDLLILIKYRA